MPDAHGFHHANFTSASIEKRNHPVRPILTDNSYLKVNDVAARTPSPYCPTLPLSHIILIQALLYPLIVMTKTIAVVGVTGNQVSEVGKSELTFYGFTGLYANLHLDRAPPSLASSSTSQAGWCEASRVTHSDQQPRNGLTRAWSS